MTLQSSLNSVSVVIPTYNRASQLAQTISSLESIGLKAVVVDGSSEPLPDVGRFNPDLITYFHRPKATYQERMSFAAAFVKTPYTISMSDDEYYCPEAIFEAVSFLNSNHDYVSCGGEAVGFSIHNGEVGFKEVYPELRGFEINLENPAARLHKHLSNYIPASYYAVVRTPTWAYAWTEISRHQFSPNGISELQFESAVSFSGKMKVLPNLMWWRNLITPPIRALGDPDKVVDVGILDWWHSKDFTAERWEFLDTMADILSGVPRVDESELENADVETVFRAFQAYSDRNWAPWALLREVRSWIFLRIRLLIGPTREANSVTIPRHIVGKNTNVDPDTFDIIYSRLKTFYGSEKV